MNKILITEEQIIAIVEEGLHTLYMWEECYSSNLKENFVIHLN